MLDECLKASEFCLQVVHRCHKQSIALSVCLSKISANRPKYILGPVLVGGLSAQLHLSVKKIISSLLERTEAVSVWAGSPSNTYQYG